MSHWIGMEVHITSRINLQGYIKWIPAQSIVDTALLLKDERGLSIKVANALHAAINVPQGSEGPIPVAYETDTEEPFMEHVHMVGHLRDRTEADIPHFLDQLWDILREVEKVDTTVSAVAYFYLDNNWHHTDVHMFKWEKGQWAGGKTKDRNNNSSVGEDLYALNAIRRRIEKKDYAAAIALIDEWRAGLDELDQAYGTDFDDK